MLTSNEILITSHPHTHRYNAPAPVTDAKKAETTPEPLPTSRQTTGLKHAEKPNQLLQDQLHTYKEREFTLKLMFLMPVYQEWALIQVLRIINPDNTNVWLKCSPFSPIFIKYILH